jgi:two-component system response regulator PhcR
MSTENLEPETVTILYVDDEEMALKYFARTVGTDYEVLTASSADAAIEILKSNQVGIVVTDYRMPGRDGGDLLRQIEREFPYVVRILVTAYAERKVLLDTVNSGEIFRILEKPLDFSEIREALRLASELARKRIAKQQRLLAIDETLAFLSHELNTPLAAISNFARGMQRRTNGDHVSSLQQAEIARAAQAMDDNARYCLSLLSTFVESVQNSDALFTHQTGSTAQQLITSLLDTYPLTPELRAAVRVEIRQDFAITALPNCVALVLSSVLSNALRALKDSPAPAVCFTVRVGETLQICISDNGPGIPPEILQRLLHDPVTTHADSGGKGWGMIFCKRIMQAFGGDIAIHSNEHGNDDTPDDETRHARFPLSRPLPPAGEGDKDSLREFHVKYGTTVTLNFPAIKRNTHE